MIVSPCRKQWCSNCWNQLVEFLMFICMQKINFISNFFFKLLQRHANCYFRNFGNTWPSPSRIILSIYRNLSWLPACKKSTSPFILFLKYCRKIANLFDMSGHKHLKWYYQFEETFDVYLLAKNQLYPLHFPWDIVNILQTCYFGKFLHAWVYITKQILSTCRKPLRLSKSKKSTSSPCSSGDIAKICKLFILSTLGMPTNAHPKWSNQLTEHFNVYLQTKNKFHHSLLSWDITF